MKHPITSPSCHCRIHSLAAVVAILAARAHAEAPPQPSPQVEALNQYFAREVSTLEGQLEREVKSREDWLAKKDEYRRQLREMLGLDPMPARSDLKATKTGEFEHEGIIVENLHYQSLPGLYVTANFYRPKQQDKPLPAILYVCGHANMQKSGVSYGNKTGYEHHGVWYAKHGFVCLVIDTVQLGEIRGEHHGTYSKGRFWWWARGYTPAGVEAWNGIRGLDYLETRPEVDKAKFGVTGRSGGGAYSWWVAALDDRIQCAVPTAGITTLRNHVVDGCVSGHCDCMYMVNTYLWDYDKVAALIAPRPLLIANSDKDGIFPLDGVYAIYQGARRIYKLLGAEKNIGLHISEGPHKDTQTLNTGEFHWMMRFLQGADLAATIDAPAVKSIAMEKLKVLDQIPGNELNTKIDRSFVAVAGDAPIPDNGGDWSTQREKWMSLLREKCFAGWPDGKTPGPRLKVLHRSEADGLAMMNCEVHDPAHPDAPLRLFIAHRAALKPQDLELVVLNVLDARDWQEFADTYAANFPALFLKDLKSIPDAKAFEFERKMFENFKWGMAYICPRGVGPSAWKGTDKEQVQRLRRYYLLGRTLESEQVWDIRCAIRALRSSDGMKDTPLWLQASRLQAGNTLYASLFEDRIARLDLHELPHSHAQGPIYLNVLKYLDLPQAVAMAAERSRVVIYDSDKAAWDYPTQIAGKLAWGRDKKSGLQVRDVQSEKD